MQSSLVVTPEQRKRTCKANTEHSNNRLTIDGSTMGVCDSDALYISQVCGKKKATF